MENEEKLNSGINGETETPSDETIVQEETPTIEEAQEKPIQNEENGVSQQESNNFNQEQVNDIIRERLSKVYNGYGVESKKELDEKVAKSNSYDVMKEDYEKAINELADLKQQVMFSKNNVKEEKVDDIKAYFKGKELELNSDNFANELSTHPEWLKENKPVTVERIGAAKVENKPKSERDIAGEMFGYKL